MSTTLTKSAQGGALAIPEERINELVACATECRGALIAAQGMQKTFVMAAAYERIGQLITPEMMRPIMALQGTSLGFKTDKDSTGGYDADTVKRVTIEATLRGLRMVDNEVNVIAGNMYGTKNGLRRLILEWPGLSDFQIGWSAPRDESGRCFVDLIAAWSLSGVADELKKTGKEAIGVRRNAGMGDDAIIGKALRKMYHAILEYLAGQNHELIPGDGEVEGDAPSGARSAGKVQRSTLNDLPGNDSKAPTKSEPSPDGSRAQLQQYRAALKSATTIRDVNEVQRLAAGDPGMTAPDKALLATECNAARNAVKNGGGHSAPQPSAISADDQQYLDELRQPLADCSSVTETNNLADIARASKLSDAAKARAVEMCGKRAGEIRAGRGGRSA